MLNLYLSVFSFKFLKRGLSIACKARSLNILSSGLWSTAMVRSGHPRTKNLALSRPYTTARPSPSMGAYLDSAEFVNRLPTKVICHPSLQQKRVVPEHLQCFWNSQKPMPDLHQSVAKHVGLCYVGYNIIISTSISVPRCNVTLWCNTVSISAPRCNKCGQMVIIFV